MQVAERVPVAEYMRQQIGETHLPIVSLSVGVGCENLSDLKPVLRELVYELVDNCAQKDVEPDFDLEIDVVLTRDLEAGLYHLVVSDNVEYQPEELKKILNNLRRVNPKQIGYRPDIHGGGLGLKRVRTELAMIGGNLMHYAQDGKIFAHAAWPAT